MCRLFFQCFLLISSLAVFGQEAYAGDFKWSGTYRAEGLAAFGSDASGGTSDKTYMLHHFILRPEIVAFDGFKIHGRFDILNNSDFPNSQLGAAFGTPSLLGPAGASGSPTGVSDDASTSLLLQNLPLGGIGVNEIYATWTHEFGVLTVGRAPMHFGLGMTFNSGRGAFDHWFDNRDLVAYKVVLGNFFVMPVFGKIHEGDIGGSDDIDDYIVQAQYENPESDLVIGGIFQKRLANSRFLTNDLTSTLIGNGATASGKYDITTWNLFFSQWIESFKLQVEVSSSSGKTGLKDASNNDIEIEGVGVALRASYEPEASRWKGVFNIGYASGDDPNTSTYEGYVFDRNFDVALLMFNHRLGQYDMLRTGLTNGSIASGDGDRTYDTEAISNVIYASVGTTFQWGHREKFQAGASITTGYLNQDPLGTNVESDLGFELDLSMKYRPIDRVQWITRAGVLLPGQAFRGGSANNFGTEPIIGIETKAAIDF